MRLVLPPTRECVAVVSAVGEQDGVGLKGIEHGDGRLAIMSLSRRQDEIEWSAFGIDERVDLGREPAPGTSHATIVSIPFFLSPRAGERGHRNYRS